MRNWILTAVFLLSSVCLANEALDELVISNGKTYTNVRLHRIEYDVAVIYHSSGIAHIPISAIPDEACLALGLPSKYEQNSMEKAQKEFTDAQTAKGLVAYGNEWMTPAEKTAREAYDKAAQIVNSKTEMAVPYMVEKALDDGLVCIKGVYNQNNQLIYAGDVFVLHGVGNSIVADREVHLDDLYWAGTFTYEDRRGKFGTVNSYALSHAEAVEIVKVKFGIGPPPGFSEQNPSAGSGGVSFGSGFFITRNGHILTNYHVIEGGTTFTVKTADQTLVAHLIAKDERNDLAIIRAPANMMPVNFIKTPSLKLGSTVFAVGFPMPTLQGVEPKVTKGVISSLKGVRDDNRFLQIDAAIQPGNSGGPLADEQGNIVGVVNSRLNDVGLLLSTGTLPQNVNYAIKNEQVQRFLSSVPEIAGMLNQGSESKLKFEDAVEAVANSTVLIEVK